MIVIEDPSVALMRVTRSDIQLQVKVFDLTIVCRKHKSI